ncbi:cytochrome b561 and DOMON domain-containing protein At5g47530-like [Gastrolobium bilobum]|uniref:cytochrome b561 and DOMON domain-containing protein At5g47530-like n=1 Tax=Gastrolobium bilobum TaxID=150636 RepID=UPI002AB07611|nr:cytochrome b561 and DOMON domain-containing protein At5g47530-like [Gastrolobium bilobum]
MLRLVLALSVLCCVLLKSSAQTCKGYTFPNKKVFSTCRDLPQLSSFLHWTYAKDTGKLHIAYTRSGIMSNNRWVAWAINPNKNNLNNAKVGAQALVAAIPDSGGALRVYTSVVSNYNTHLEEGNISYPHSNLKATCHNNEVTIFATLTLPKGTSSFVHLWQDGPLIGSTPHMHDKGFGNLNSKEILDLV